MRTASGGGRGSTSLWPCRPFVPKTHTPFQWEAQISLTEMEARIRHLRDAVRPHKNLTLRWHEPAMSHLEGILSRGDRRLAEVVERAYRKGGIFSSWVEGFDLTPWKEALDECGMTANSGPAAADPDGPLPWDHLWAGTSRRFLSAERRRALSGAVTRRLSLRALSAVRRLRYQGRPLAVARAGL